MKNKIKLNNLLFFRYKAIGEGKIPFYDKTPLAIVIDIRKDSILCINTHWIPALKRREFFEEFRDLISKTDKKTHERKRLTYLLLRKPQYRISLEAIRMYYISGITQLKIIPEPQWTILFGYGISQYKKRIVHKTNEYKD